MPVINNNFTSMFYEQGLMNTLQDVSSHRQAMVFLSIVKITI